MIIFCCCFQECVKSTFDFIIQNSIIEDNSSHPGLSTAGTPFQFFYSVIKQMKSVIHEDRNVYAPCISRPVYNIILILAYCFILVIDQ